MIEWTVYVLTDFDFFKGGLSNWGLWASTLESNRVTFEYDWWLFSVQHLILSYDYRLNVIDRWKFHLILNFTELSDHTYQILILPRCDEILLKHIIRVHHDA